MNTAFLTITGESAETGDLALMGEIEGDDEGAGHHRAAEQHRVR